MKQLQYILFLALISCQPNKSNNELSKIIREWDHREIKIPLTVVCKSLGKDTFCNIANFTYPVIYDYHNDFERLNHFPPAPYRTFLLDKDHKVLLVGSPIDDPKMWALYKKIITQSQ